MAYQEFDLNSPVRGEWTLNSKAKKTILDGWPTKIVNGEEVFGTIGVAHDQHYTPISKKQEAIMKIFGVPLDTMKTQDWKGVQDSWFQFKTADIDSAAISKLMIYSEITRYSTTENRHNEHEMVFQHVSYDAPLDYDAIESIKWDFVNGVNLKRHHALDDDTSEPTWHIAYADKDGLIYNRRFVVRPPIISTDYDGRKTYETRISLIYSLPEDKTMPIAMDVDSVLQRVKDNDVWPNRYMQSLYNPHPGAHLDGQINNSDDLYVAEVTGSHLELQEDGTYKQVNDYRYHLKVSALANLKLKAFSKFIKTILDYKYTLRKAPWWQKVVAAIVVIIIIVIAVIITVYSVGTSAPATLSAAVSMIAAVASAIAITATIISFALGAYASWLTDHGYAGSAILIGRCAVTFSQIAKYAGYVALIAGIGNILINGFYTAAPAGAEEGVDGVIENSSGTLVVPMSNIQIFNQVLSWINSAATFYEQYDSDKDQKDLDNKQSEVDAQVKLLEDYSSPKSMAIIQKTFESGQMYEPYFQTPSYVYGKTQGMIDLATTKYY